MRFGNQAHGIGKRVLALFLSVLMAFSLCTTALAAEDAGGGGNEDNGYLTLKVYPRIGSSTASPDKSYTSSFISNIMLNKDDSINASDSVFGFVVKAEYYVGGVVDTTKDVQVWATTSQNDSFSRAEYKNEPGKQQFDFPLDQSTDSVWYFYATCGSSSMELNATVKRLHTKAASIGYHRIGMQVRAINETPFGVYDYLTNEGSSWVKNGAAAGDGGMFLSGTADHYSSKLETAKNDYPKCYFDINFGDSTDSAASAAVTGISNLADLYTWLATYTKAMEKAGKNIGDTVKLTGPAYVECENGSQGDKMYSLAYYNPEGAGGINSYAGWGDRTKDDFVALRFLTVIVPTVLIGKITVNCYNEDTGNLIGTKLVNSKEFHRTNDSDTFNNSLRVLGDTFHEAYEQQFNSISKYDDTTGQYTMDVDKFADVASSLSYDAAQKKIVPKVGVEESIANIQKVIDARDAMLKGIDSSSNTWMKSFMGLTEVSLPTTADIPALAHYQFDFGVGMDAISAKNLGLALMTASDTKTTIITDQTTPEAELDLYYKAAGTTYTVQVSNNGTVIPELTKTYPAAVGDIIKEEDVDKSIVPSDYKIQVVDNVPLTVKEDQTKNIITIVCGDKLPYKVMYYCGTTLKDTVSYSGNEGATITTVPIKSYTGYVYSSTDGLPLKLEYANQIVRVYYVPKEPAAPTPSVNMTLYSDAYKTKVKTLKSGYGVYSYFVVDASDYFDKTSTWNYRADAGCGTYPASITKPKYINVEVTAVATWTDYLKGSQKNVSLVLDHKTPDHKYYFRLPNNTGSKTRLPKAYIPVSWKDRTNWTISAVGTIAYEEIYWWNTIGHDSDFHPGKPGHMHYWTYDIPHYRYDPKKKTLNGSASIMVNGNMYEDDFTGSKR